MLKKMARKQETLNEEGVTFLSTLAEEFIENENLRKLSFLLSSWKIWTSKIQILRDTYPRNTNPERNLSEKYRSWRKRLIRAWHGPGYSPTPSCPSFSSFRWEQSSWDIVKLRMIKLAQYTWNNDYITIQLEQCAWSNKITTIKLGHRFNPFLHRRLQASISTGQ